MPPSPQRDPVPPHTRRVLDLFRGALQAVRFPDVDLESLSTSEAELFEAELAFEAAERGLEAARIELAARAAALTLKAERGLAYARVFAQSDEALRAEVDAASAPSRAPAVEPPPPKRRGRPRKQPEEVTPMFEATPPAVDAA